MATPYSDVYDLFLQRIKDWRLDSFYNTDPTGFKTYLKGFLVLAVPYYEEVCQQSLARDDSAETFDEDLTDANKEILSMGMAIAWLEKSVQDVRQMELHIADKDFKTYSEAQNLRAKEERLEVLREQYSQRVTETAWYGYDMTNWLAGNFSGD